MMRVGVLASGSGSNFQALVDALNVEGSPARVTVLVCNVAGARVLERARAANVPTDLLEHKQFSDRPAYDAALVEHLKKHGVELVCLAGFMRLIGPLLLEAFPDRVINLHPALLPSFPGLHAARQALSYGVKLTGCTVHFVDEGTDTGPIIAQAVVPVLDSDDEPALTARIHAEEHRLYPEVVRWIAQGRVAVSGRKVTVARA
jgi:phosphoribosylglycinamide formyltransferase 1